MNKKSGSGSGPFLMEMLAAVGFFIVCASICVSVFARADRMSRQAMDLNQGVLAAQTVVEEFRSGEPLAEEPCVWDGDWVRYESGQKAMEAGHEVVYLPKVTWKDEDGLKKIDVQILKTRNGQETLIFELHSEQYSDGPDGTASKRL